MKWDKKKWDEIETGKDKNKHMQKTNTSGYKRETDRDPESWGSCYSRLGVSDRWAHTES
jgi:hypothetical protein